MEKVTWKVIRNDYLSSRLYKILKEKNIKKTELALRMNLKNNSNLINILNWKKIASDEFYRDIMEAIPLTSSEIKEIFFEATKKELAHEYGWNMDTNTTKNQIIDELKDEFLEEMSLSREFRNNERALNEAREIWEYLKEKYWN